MFLHTKMLQFLGQGLQQLEPELKKEHKNN